MKILVYMKDGRTVYLLRNRKQLREMLVTKAAGEHESVPVVRGIWNPFTAEYAWQRVPLRHLPATSIGVVEEARGLDDAVAMLKPDPEDAARAVADAGVTQPTAEAVGKITEGEGH